MSSKPSTPMAWLVVLLSCASCSLLASPAPPPALSERSSSHQDLLTGYGLLAHTLGDLSRLRRLKLFKEITLRGPIEEVRRTMDLLTDASKNRAGELGALRKLSPDVSDAPATRSPIGDAITAVAKELGKQEMLDRSGAFNLRFVLLQAQATRMVGAMANAIREFEPNAERRDWLARVASEYEGYRNDLIDVLQRHLARGGMSDR